MKINIETTNHCNARCICCPNKDMTRPRGYMELELLNRIIKQLPENVNEICLSIFGEPLMDHRLPEVLTIVRKLYRKRLLFFTNGSLLGDWIDDAIYENLDEIIISFLGWSPESYHKNMGLNFNEIVPRIKYFIANAPDKLKIKVISLDLGYTPQKVLAFKKLFPEGVILPARNWGHYQTSQDGTATPCGRPNSLHILWDGVVVLCCRDYEAEVVLGDLKRQTIDEVWNSKRYVELRRLFNQGRKPERICKTCHPL